MSEENTIFWKTKDEMQKELDEIGKNRDRKKYGRDGYVVAGKGKFSYKGISYLIRVLRYFNLDDGFTTMCDRKSEYHVVIERPKESKPFCRLIEKLDVENLLYYDTAHTWNDNQTLEEQIEECHETAKEMIDDIPGFLDDAIDSIIEQLNSIKKVNKKFELLGAKTIMTTKKYDKIINMLDKEIRFHKNELEIMDEGTSGYYSVNAQIIELGEVKEKIMEMKENAR